KELVLEVDEPLRRAQRPEVRLEDRELAAGQSAVDPFRHRANELDVELARARRRLLPAVVLARQLAPAEEEVLGDVLDGGAAQEGRGVVPPDARSSRMDRRVEAVAGERGEVDPADERDGVVDDDELLVMAVQRTLAAVEDETNSVSGHELVARGPHLPPVRMEERQRRARPGEDSHVHAGGEVSEQLPERRPVGAA